MGWRVAMREGGAMVRSDGVVGGGGAMSWRVAMREGDTLGRNGAEGGGSAMGQEARWAGVM